MRYPLLLLVAGVLTACASAGRWSGDTAPAVYDFGLAVTPLASQARENSLVLEIRAPAWFDTPGIDYRLGYAEVARLREYTQARWAAPPAQLIQQRIAQRLRLSPAGQGRSECVLRIELAEFSQLFVAANESQALLQGRLWLLEKARRPVAEMAFDIRQPANTPDAQGGVHALKSAVDQLAEQISMWEMQLQKEKERPLGSCARL